jgi:hypothetical protein
MRNLLITIFFCLLSGYTSAQDMKCQGGWKTKKRTEQEIGVNLYNFSVYKSSFVYHAKPVIDQGFFNGLFYKRHFGKNAFRATIDHFYTRINTEYDWGMLYYKNTGIKNTLELRLGYERKLAIGKLFPYLAADAVFNVGRARGSRLSWGDMIPDLTERPYDTRAIGIGLAPAIGLKYRPVRQLAISLEANAGIMKIWQREAIAKNDFRDAFSSLFFYPVRVWAVSYYF